MHFLQHKLRVSLLQWYVYHSMGAFRCTSAQRERHRHRNIGKRKLKTQVTKVHHANMLFVYQTA